jgi:hypothetical protein
VHEDLPRKQLDDLSGGRAVVGATLDVAAIVVSGTLVGNELAVAVFFHPRIRTLDDATHVLAARTLAQALGVSAR